MADAHWRYADPRQQHQQQQQMLPPSVGAPNAAAPGQQQPLKRPRAADYSADVSGAHEMAGYYPREEERAGYAAVRETQALNASYERFLRTGQIQPYGAGPAGGPIRPAAGGNAGYQSDDRVVPAGGMDGRNAGIGGGISERPLPPDASNTLFIEGIPTDCERREVSHIFRPFVGFQEVRLVTKDPRHPGGDPIVLCFVDFANAAQAAMPWKLCKAISLMNTTAVHLICGYSMLVLRVRGGSQDLVVVVVVVLGVKLLARSFVNLLGPVVC